jgi:hypothetical protein
VLWQVGALGDPGYPPRATPERLRVLVEYLGRWYPPSHETVVYEAAPYPTFPPLAEPVALGALPGFEVTPLATLFVPPLERPAWDPTMAARLGLPPAAPG